jgi:hypothetical protein
MMMARELLFIFNLDGRFRVIQSSVANAFMSNNAKRLPTVEVAGIKGRRDGLARCRQDILKREWGIVGKLTIRGRRRDLWLKRNHAVGCQLAP